jgi:anti-anti-sigma factor
VSTQSSLQVIRLGGELDIGRRDEIARALRLGAGRNAILLDFSDVSYADSTVIAELLRFRSDAGRAERRIALLIGSRQFERLLQYAGLSEAFAVFGDRAAALTYLTAPGPP